jgi:uncharacterized protein YicC (UPF0701 family)
MEVKSYCEKMDQQLKAWKAAVNEVVRGMERMSRDESAALAPSLTTLNTLADELTAGLVALSDQCPTEWSSQRESLDEKFTRMKGTLASLSERVGLPDTLSWL